MEFAPCYDKNMYSLVCKSHTAPSHRRNLKNMRAWYEGYLSQYASDSNGISKELFSQAMSIFIECNQEAIPIWINFAVECVELEQYVDFFEEPDKSTATNR